MKGSIKQKALSGSKWSAIFQFGRYGITFFLSIILARLLEPEDFGLLGMLNIFSAIALVFINSGLSTAIIRTKEATSEDYSTVFYFNIVVSFGFYLLFYFTAPLIANFYNQPILIPLTRLITLVFVINAFGVIQNAILIKAINFKKQTIINLVGLAFSVIIASAMAFNGFGVYSIVGQAISQAFITNLLLWLTSNWRPKGGFNKLSFLRLWAFGSKILATSIVSRIIENIDNILIGKIFSASQLGFYIRAKSTKDLPEQTFTSILSTTTFAVLSKVNDTPSELRRLHFEFYKLGAYVFLPIVFGFIAIAKAFTIVLYSEKWLPSVPIFQIIILSSIAYFFSALFSQTLMAIGNSTLYLKLNTVKKLLSLLAIPFGIFWGLYPFIITFVSISFINLMLDIIFVGREININVTNYIIALVKPVILSIVMSFLVYAVTFLNITNNLLLLLIQMLSGIFLYILLSFVFKVNEFFYLKEIVIAKYKNIKVKL